jgi:hypothetical protein
MNANTSSSSGPFPPENEILFIGIDDVAEPVLLDGFAYWKTLCGARAFPPRGAVTVRGLGRLLRHTLLLRVIEGGKDYEYRIVGDAHVVAHGLSVQGKLWSQAGDPHSVHRQMNKIVYDRVAQGREPVALRSWMEREIHIQELVYREGIYLPLGEAGAVDHILAFSVYKPYLGPARG